MTLHAEIIEHDCGKSIAYSLDLATGEHFAVIWDDSQADLYRADKPGEMYSILADYRDNPEVLALLNWLV